jgi:CIC family chloride channel protein
VADKFSNFSRFHAFRYRLGEHDAVLPLALLGAVSGILTGVVIALFRSCIEGSSLLFINHLSVTATAVTNPDQFEQLSAGSAFWLVLGGAVLLGIVFQLIPANRRHTGLGHVVVALHKNNAKLRIRNALLQFAGAVIALASGQSGGREGPAIHLGTACNSYFAQRLHLPHNSLRVLAACGAAAAIGASFNTPVAGVIFAMEVIVMEYTLVGFIPVILASITATSVSQLFFGDSHVFTVPPMALESMWELPYLLLLGLACGLAALAFMRVQLLSQQLQRWPVALRFTLAGLLTASIGMLLPGVLGTGYDTVNTTLNAEFGTQLIIMLCLAKILTAAVSSGVGMPIGIIGPSLFIGACVGGGIGNVSSVLQGELHSGTGFYVLLGMGGVMGALLNAPLAALIAILELAHTPSAMLPGITVIVIASLITNQIFGRVSAVENVLRNQGLSIATHPVAQALNRISLSAVVDTNIGYLNAEINRADLKQLVINDPRHIVIQDKTGGHVMVSRKSWRHAICDHFMVIPEFNNSAELLRHIDELALPVMQLTDIDIAATVTEARDRLQKEPVDGLYITDKAGGLRGILRGDALNKLIENW